MGKSAARQLSWTRNAGRQLLEAWLYVAADDPRAADDMADRILIAARYIALHAMAGRRGRRSGTREFAIPHTPFLLVYRNRPRSVQIIRLLHHSLKYP